jgi:hypothetical protein
MKAAPEVSCQSRLDVVHRNRFAKTKIVKDGAKVRSDNRSSEKFEETLCNKPSVASAFERDCDLEIFSNFKKMD